MIAQSNDPPLESHTKWFLKWLLAVGLLCWAAATAPAEGATAGCARTAAGDTVTVVCKTTGLVGYSFLARSTRPGTVISYSHTCENAGPVGKNGGLDGPAMSTRVKAVGRVYYDRIDIAPPAWVSWVCTVRVSASSSPSPIRPELGVTIVKAIHA